MIKLNIFVTIWNQSYMDSCKNEIMGFVLFGVSRNADYIPLISRTPYTPAFLNNNPHTYISKYVCVCVCRIISPPKRRTTHSTHTHTCIYTRVMQGNAMAMVLKETSPYKTWWVEAGESTRRQWTCALS